MKKIILIDMDGVLVKEPEYIDEKYKDIHWSDIPDIFLNLDPMDNAISSFNKLSQDFDVYIVSTAPWGNPSAWTDKRKWVEKHLPIATKKLMLTHHKNMIIGDYLIDDRTKNGVDKFKGKHIHFGQEPFKNWDSIIKYFYQVNEQQ